MRKVLVAAAIAATGYGVWHWQAEPATRDVVRDRLWVDHVPRSERESFKVFVVMKDRPFGAFHDGSLWKGSYERFRYEMQGSQIRMLFPQNGDRENVRLNVSRCDQDGMDYCLQLDGSSRGVKRYYSREDWVIRSLDDADAKLRTLE